MNDITLTPDRGLAVRSAIGSVTMFAILIVGLSLIGSNFSPVKLALIVGFYLVAMLGFALLIEARRRWTLGADRITAANGTQFPLRADTEAQIRWGMLILRNPGGARLVMRNLPDPQAAADMILERARQVAR